MKNKLINRISQLIFSQLGIFLISGGLITLFDMGLLYIFKEYLGIHYLLSGALSFLIASVLNYIASRKWIFKSGREKVALEYNLFLLFSVFGILLNHGTLWLFTEVVNLHYLVSKIISIVLITAFNYFTRKHIVFREKR